MKHRVQLLVLAVSLVLEGCYTPIVEGLQEGYDAARRDPLHAAAVAGKPVAQHELGNAYCCDGGGPMDMVSVYDNRKATYWYCRAARQGYGPAQMSLARVYSGHPVRGLHLVLRASALVGNAETDIAVALLWASVAANQGTEDATALRDTLMEQANGNERARAASLAKNWRAAPCAWGEVFAAGRITR